MSKKKNLCWTCSRCMTIECPKHENPTIEKKMWRTKVYECDKYDYDGECFGCIMNTEHLKGALYDICPHYIKGCRGYCAQENWKKLKHVTDEVNENG